MSPKVIDPKLITKLQEIKFNETITFGILVDAIKNKTFTDPKEIEIMISIIKSDFYKNFIARTLVDNNFDLEYYYQYFSNNSYYVYSMLNKYDELVPKYNIKGNELWLSTMLKVIEPDKNNELFLKHLNANKLNHGLLKEFVVVLDREFITQDNVIDIVYASIMNDELTFDKLHTIFVPKLVNKYYLELVKKDIRFYTSYITAVDTWLDDKNNYESLIEYLFPLRIEYMFFRFCKFDHMVLKDNEFLIKLIKDNQIGHEFITNYYGFTVNKHLLELYNYLTSRKEECWDRVLFTYRTILTNNNFIVESIISDLDIRYELKEDNRELILDTLRKLSERGNFNANINIKCDKYDPLFFEETEQIFPGKILISPKELQGRGHCSYSIYEIKEKERILNNYAKSVLYSKDNEGNIKELSPLEKYLAVYRIVTNFSHYEENEMSSNDDSSRALYQLIDSKKTFMVCLGYSNLLVDLLRRVGIIDCIPVSVVAMPFGSTFSYAFPNHSRVSVYLKDDKYGIEGIFMADPTWDSIDERDYEENYKPYDLPITHALMSKSEVLAIDKVSHQEPNLRLKDFIEGIHNRIKSNGNQNISIEECENLFNKPIPKESIAQALLSVDYFSYKDKRIPTSFDPNSEEFKSIVDINEYNNRLAKLSLFDKIIGLDEQAIKYYNEVTFTKNTAINNWGFEELVRCKAISLLYKKCDEYISKSVDLTISINGVIKVSLPNETKESLSNAVLRLKETGYIVEIYGNTLFIDELFDCTKSIHENERTIIDLVKNISLIILEYNPSKAKEKVLI